GSGPCSSASPLPLPLPFPLPCDGWSSDEAGGGVAAAGADAGAGVGTGAGAGCITAAGFGLTAASCRRGGRLWPTTIVRRTTCALTITRRIGVLVLVWADVSRSATGGWRGAGGTSTRTERCSDDG